MLQLVQYIKMNFSKLLLFFVLLPIYVLAVENKTLESQPQVLFEHKNLMEAQEKRELIIKFNTAVLYLEQQKYQEAISLFKQTAKLIKVASFLNIGIAYYKLNSEKNAYLYLKKIYDLKELSYKDKFSYFSAAYYLYKITNDKDYINEITKVSAKAKRLTENEKNLVVDTLILQKKYEYALNMLKEIKNSSDLKIAILYLKLADYAQAKIYLDKAYEKAGGDEEKNKILWIKMYRDLKSNDIININEEIVKIENRQKIFSANKEMQFELFFNKNKYSSKEYFDMITKFTDDRKYDFIYYFAPFIFEDYDVMNSDATKAFIIKNQDNISELNTMIKYNADFLKVIKLDPIYRVQVLQDMIDAKVDTNAYEYYNLALCYAQIYDYAQAYKYFQKAYNLDHGNKLYSVMTILSAKKLGITIDKVERELIVKNIKSKKGSYRYLAKYLYKIIEDPTVELDATRLTNEQKKSIFFRALYFIENVNNNGINETEPLLVEFQKDPLVYLLSLVARQKGENDYTYISRIQDNLPKIYNNTFLKGSLLITDFYLDTLRALGLFNRTDFNISNSLEPSYLRTKAIVQLYNDNPKDTIKLIEYIQKKYRLKSMDSFYLLIASYLSSKQDELAFVTLTEIEFIYNDNDAKYLSGVKLIQDLKLNTAPQYFTNKLKGSLIDIRLNNLDNYLESL